MKWRRFGQVEKKEEEGARNPATTIMKKVTDEDAGSTNNGHNSKGAAARPPIGEGDCPTFLSPPVRHQSRRRSGEDFVGRSKWKKKRKGGIFGFALQPPQQRWRRGHRRHRQWPQQQESGGAALERPSGHNRLQILYHNIYTRRRGPAHLPLTTGEMPEEERKGLKAMGSRWATV